tara:strand:+ start:306 stop:1289 length:984 start_codon:yes stop_codon:yes gene_type:complete
MSNVGQAPVGVLARALTGNIFVEQSLAYMNEGNKDSYNAYKHDVKNVLRAYSANAAATVANSSAKNSFNRVLTIVESFETFNPADYHNIWKEYQATGEFQWEELPSEVQATLEELFLGSAAEAVQEELTNGDGTLVTGLVPQLLSAGYSSLDGVDATPAQVVANTKLAFRASAGLAGDSEGVALSTANIFQKLEILIKKQTKAMRKRAGRKFMVSHGTADIIREAQRLELNFKGVDTTEEGIMRYAGYDIIENSSFPDDSIMFASMTGDMKTDAIQLGTSMSSDFNNLEVNRLSNFGREYGMLLTFAIDIFVVRPEEVCFYTTETIA